MGFNVCNWITAQVPGSGNALPYYRLLVDQEEVLAWLAHEQDLMRKYIDAHEQVRLLAERASQCVQQGSLSPEEGRAASSLCVDLIEVLHSHMRTTSDVAEVASRETERLKQIQAHYSRSEAVQ
jgi:hypothetical protein